MYSLTLAIIGLNLLAGVNPSTETVEFKYVHPLGKTIHYRYTITSDQLWKMGNSPVRKSSSSGTNDLVYTCVKINPDGTGVYKVSIPLLEEKATTDNQTVFSRFEAGKSMIVSKSPALSDQVQSQETNDVMNEIGNKSKQARVDARFTMIVGPDGSPRKVQGYAESINKALKDLKPASQMGQRYLDQIITGSTDKSMLKTMRGYRSLFPARKILRIGEAWNDEVEQETYGKKHKIKREWKLVGVETIKGRCCAKIEIDSLPYVFEVSTDKLKHRETRDKKAVRIAYLDYQNGLIVQSETRYEINIRQLINTPNSKEPLENQQTMANIQRTELISP